MLIFAAVDAGGGPLGEALAEKAARCLRFFGAGFFSVDGAIMEGESARCVVRHAEDEETEVHEDREDGLAGEFHPTAPPSGGTEGATDFAVNLHPMLVHDVVPKAFHFPGEDAHISWAADRNAIAPKDVFGCGIAEIAQANFRIGNSSGAFSHEFGHFGNVTCFGIV